MELSELDVRGFLALLRRQFRLILVTIVLVMVVSGIVVFSLTPIYSASALILVDPSRKNLLDPELQGSASSGDSARIDSEVEILRSDSVLLKVIESSNLVADPEFGPSMSRRNQIMAFLRLADLSLPTGESALNQSLGKLRGAITVQRRGATYLISVQVRSEEPARAALIANALAEAYIQDQLSSKVNSTLASRDILQARISEARQAILQSESDFDDFVKVNIDSIVQDTGRTDIAQMQQQLQEFSTSREQSLAIADQMQASLDRGDLSTLTSTLQSEALAELERQRNELAQTIADGGTESPTTASLREELAALDERLAAQATTEVNALRQSVTQSESQEAALRQDIRSAVLGSSSLSADTLTRLYEFQQNAEIARGQYQTLLARVQDLDAQATLQVADSRIVSPALAPSSPAFPNTPLVLMASLAAAIALGVALALLYENVLGGFTSEAQLESVLKRRVAASIPRVKKIAESTLANMMVESPLSVYAEAVRRVRSTIEQVTRDRNGGDGKGLVVMVCSTAPAEGKSTLALSLARTYALSGRSTLLIDCDLRKPSIHKQLSLEPSLGLLELLSSDEGTLRVDSTLTKDPLTEATVIVGARRSGLPTDQLISGQQFRHLITASRKTFDVVVIDTPPIGPVVDAAYIAPLVDAILYVVRWAGTSQTEAREGIRTLSLAAGDKTPVMTVLSQQEVNRASYRQKYGSYYAEYNTPS